MIQLCQLPNKCQPFDGYSPPSSNKRKDGGEKEVEVLYADGVSYRGWLSSYNFDTRKWIVKLYDDDGTEVNFPDKEVKNIIHHVYSSQSSHYTPSLTKPRSNSKLPY